MKTVLVVDDEPNLVELLQIRLEGNHFQVITATNGVEAFAVAKDKKPDLIILDVNMPAMDGYEFVKEIKYQIDLKDVPILVLTGKDDLRDLFADEGIKNYMTKPFESKVLINKVLELCGE